MSKQEFREALNRIPDAQFLAGIDMLLYVNKRHVPCAWCGKMIWRNNKVKDANCPDCHAANHRAYEAKRIGRPWSTKRAA